MTTNDPLTRNHAKRENATRRAFLIWMAAYAAVVVAIAFAHTLGGLTSGTTIDANGIRTQQAKVIGAPQSSLAGRILPANASYDRDG
jgi:cytochrome bd-type quinol oxidase subunit 2